MYYIHDFLTDNYIPCKDEHDVAHQWKRYALGLTRYDIRMGERSYDDLMFEQLNVTGNDT